jgi:hypothetical protein
VGIVRVQKVDVGGNIAEFFPDVLATPGIRAVADDIELAGNRSARAYPCLTVFTLARWQAIGHKLVSIHPKLLASP